MMRHPEFPVVSFLCFVLLICTLPSHIRARSVSTIALIAWMGTMSLIRGINSLIWASNVDVKLQVWCDITTKITIGFTIAIPAAALCILRHLESVSSTQQARTTKADKRGRQKFEIFMCFCVPVIFMALHYIVQGHRYDLYEDFGCYPTTYISIAGLILVYIPPLLISLSSFVYAAMALAHFFRHRIEFANYLRTSHAAISAGRYYRLMSLAVMEMIWDTGINTYIIYYNTSIGLRPWISWANVHSNFSRVQLVPEFVIPSNIKSQLLFQWWIIPVSCIGFFAFFGFSDDAIADYRVVIVWFRRTVLRQSSVDNPPSQDHSTVLPSHRSHTPHVKVTFLGTLDSTYKDESTPWDALSLKMPDTPDTVVGYPSMTSKDKTSLSLDNLERSTSIDTSTSFPYTTEGDPSPTHFPPTYETSYGPPFSVTQPDNADYGTSVTPRAPPIALCRDHSNTIICPPPNFRRSTSTDIAITVSPAYLPVAETSPRYHE